MLICVEINVTSVNEADNTRALLAMVGSLTLGITGIPGRNIIY